MFYPQKPVGRSWVTESLGALALYFTVAALFPGDRPLLLDLALFSILLMLACRLVCGLVLECVRSMGRIADLHAK